MLYLLGFPKPRCNKQIPYFYTFLRKFWSKFTSSKIFVILCLTHLWPIWCILQEKCCNRWKCFPNISHLHCSKAFTGHVASVFIVHMNSLWRKPVKVRVFFQELSLDFHQQLWYSPNILYTTCQSAAKLH